MEISQKKFLFGKRHITIDENKVTVAIEKFNSKNEYSFDIEVISEHSNQIKKIPQDWLGAIIVVTLINIFLVIWLFHVPGDGKPAVAVFLTVFAFVWIICLVKLRMNSINSLLFFNRFDGNVVLELFRDHPNHTEFTAFVEFLKKKISVSYEQQKNLKKSFSYELHEIVKLKEDGLLDEREFKILKEGLINKTVEPAKIGF